MDRSSTHTPANGFAKVNRVEVILVDYVSRSARGRAGGHSFQQQAAYNL